MKITVFTCNQPRHISLINDLSKIADTVYAVQECKTIFPGQVEDRYRKSPVMEEYFAHVLRAETDLFGNVGFVRENVRTISMKSGDLSKIEMPILADALDSDYYIVFGASFIKGDLVKYLTDNKAINIHIGASPYYRGSSCNFWAAYDGNHEYVAATVHLLSSGMDSGDMLYHALPKAGEYDSFALGMQAVKAAHESIIHLIERGKVGDYRPTAQDKSLEIRYSRNADFTDEIAEKYLRELPTPGQIAKSLENRDMQKFVNPYVGGEQHEGLY